ncbi:glycoprotein VI platelet, partial [Chelydra serpentina]
GLGLTACLLPPAEPSYPKPSISLSPSGGVSLGGIVAVWCRVQRRGMRFVLNKERRHFPLVDSDRLGVVFSIRNVSQADGGSYSCYYYNRSEPVAVSYASDPVVLVVRGGWVSLDRCQIGLMMTGPRRASPPNAQPHLGGPTDRGALLS